MKAFIRRKDLRGMVPLSDSMIYEMEDRGEFPKRFNLTPRCVVWDKSEVEAWMEARKANPAMPKNSENLDKSKFRNKSDASN